LRRCGRCTRGYRQKGQCHPFHSFSRMIANELAARDAKPVRSPRRSAQADGARFVPLRFAAAPAYFKRVPSSNGQRLTRFGQRDQPPPVRAHVKVQSETLVNFASKPGWGNVSQDRPRPPGLRATITA
jgi:hypothetical protein